MENLQPGTQLFVNNKWYFDIKSVDTENVRVRIKYYEGSNKAFSIYKVIKLPVSIFKNVEPYSFIYKCTVADKDLKREIGGLIDRLVREQDITRIMEDMGSVSSPGLSGVAGQTGSAGSGDISSVLPAGSFGLEKTSLANKKQMKRIVRKGKNVKNGIRTPLLNLFKENADPDVDAQVSDNDYKLSVYQFLDYPTDNDWDIKFLETINEWRASFLEASMQRIKQYFMDLYNTNRALIKNKCSDWFQNNIIILGDIKDDSE